MSVAAATLAENRLDSSQWLDPCRAVLDLGLADGSRAGLLVLLALGLGFLLRGHGLLPGPLLGVELAPLLALPCGGSLKGALLARTGVAGASLLALLEHDVVKAVYRMPQLALASQEQPGPRTVLSNPLELAEVLAPPNAHRASLSAELGALGQDWAGVADRAPAGFLELLPGLGEEQLRVHSGLAASSVRLPLG